MLNTDGSFTYTPNAGYTGPDSFTYMANDGTVDSAPATVYINSTPPLQGPWNLDDVGSVSTPGTSASNRNVLPLT